MTRRSAPSRSGAAAFAGRIGFTLIELLVVIGIIALLAAIVLGVGPKVLGSQKRSLTVSTLHALDGALDSVMSASGGAPPPYRLEDYEGVPGYFLADPSNEGDGRLKTASTTPPNAGWSEFPRAADPLYPRFPDAAVFLRQAAAISPQTGEVLRGLPTRLVRATATEEDQSTAIVESDQTPSILDGWGPKGGADWEPRTGSVREEFVLFDGLPILFVHPTNTLAQALYGKCLNGRPYFMSAGEDRLYGVTNQFSINGERNPAAVDRALKALQDNLYSYTPGPADITPNSSVYQNLR